MNYKIEEVWDEMISHYIRTLAPSIDIAGLKESLARKWLSDAWKSHITFTPITFNNAPAKSTTCPCGIRRADCEYHR